MAETFAGFERKLAAIERDLTDKRTLTRLGVQAKGDAVEALRADIGDQSLSNWRRRRPIDLTPRFEIEGDQVHVAPKRGAVGPTRVLTAGRQAGVSRRGRPVSASRGKGTWDDAVELMERRTPERVHREVQAVLRRHLTGA